MIDLTKRERWLMAKAFFDGWEHAQIYTNDPQQKDVDGWLNSDACDGATVSEVLAKAAPEADRIEELEADRNLWRDRYSDIVDKADNHDQLQFRIEAALKLPRYDMHRSLLNVNITSRKFSPDGRHVDALLLRETLGGNDANN